MANNPNLYDPFDDDNNNNQPQTGQVTTQTGAVGQQPTGQQASPSAAPTIGAGGAGGAVQSRRSPQTARAAGSGRFQNLQKFITANLGEGQRLGQGVQQNIQQRGQQVAQNIQQQQQQLQQQAQQAQQQAQQLGQQIQQDPTQLLQDQAQREQLQAFQTGAASDIGIDRAGLQQQLGEIGDLAQQVQSEAGRSQLIRETYVPEMDYTRGLGSLDQMLLQRDADFLAGLESQSKEQMGELQEQFGGLEETLAEQTGLIETEEQQLQDLLQEQLTGQQTSLETKAQDILAEDRARNEALRQRLGETRALDDETLDQLGVTDPQQRDLLKRAAGMEFVQTAGVGGGERITGREKLFDLGQYLGDVKEDFYNPVQQASLEEVQRANALSQLMGGGKLYDETMAGSGTGERDVRFRGERAAQDLISKLQDQWVGATGKKIYNPLTGEFSDYLAESREARLGGIGQDALRTHRERASAYGGLEGGYFDYQDRFGDLYRDFVESQK